MHAGIHTPGQTATAVDGTHPTGIHSCRKDFRKNLQIMQGFGIVNLYSLAKQSHKQ